jgi:hypothetical protein
MAAVKAREPGGGLRHVSRRWLVSESADEIAAAFKKTLLRTNVGVSSRRSSSALASAGIQSDSVKGCLIGSALGSEAGIRVPEWIGLESSGETSN